MRARSADRLASRTIFAAVAAAALLQALLRPGVGALAEGAGRRGADLFANSCATCHGTAGEGTAQGPPLVGVGTAAVDFMLSTGRMPLADPNQQPTRQRPAFTRAEIEDLVAYVRSLGPGGVAIPAVDPSAGDLAVGRELFADNCMACHGAGATGDAVGGGQIAPALDAATPLQIAEAARIGPGQMPPFGEDLLDRRDLDSLTRYVTFLQGSANPGGAALGRIGPVAEGFVALVLGLGLLLVVIRFTGTRR